MNTTIVQFMQKYYMQHILYFLELMACITSFSRWKKVKESYWRWFPVYLLLIVIVELTADYLNYTGRHLQKDNLYTMFGIPLELLFLMSIYYHYANNNKSRWLIIAGGLLYLMVFVLDQLSVFDNSTYFNSVSYSVGNLVLLIAILSFFIQFARGNEILYYKTSMIFWVSVGVLVFYMGSLPFYGLFHLLFKNYRPVFVVYSYVVLILNWIMYVFFIVAFIWGKPK